jgi:hypothetical protein
MMKMMGYFHMNTPEELRIAFEEYRQYTFIKRRTA